MKYQIYLFLTVLMLVLTSCKDSRTSNYSDKNVVEVKTKTSNNHPGKKILETKCYVCHSPSAPEKEGRIGPPMIAVKAHYITEQTTKKEFTAAMWSFLENPSIEKVKLHGAVKRFGVMPYQQFKKEEITKIAEYIFDYQIEDPEWFKEHWENGHKIKREPYKNNGKKNIESNNLTYKEIGLKYALNTKKELGKNLMGTIQKEGTLKAVTFCNKKAYPITDSMAVVQNASIRRVSDKPRNPKNQANTKELKVIANYKIAIANNKEYQPITNLENGKVKFYAPIITNSMCLQCHGVVGKDVVSEVYRTVSSLYPTDKALGYKANEVRGIWSITFQE